MMTLPGHSRQKSRLDGLLPALGALAAIALLSPAPAAAKCVQLSESESRQVSDVVFEGVVGGHVGESAEAAATPGKPATVRRFEHFRFRVARYLQGEGQDNVEVSRALIPDSFPRTDPRPGEAWRVYARRTSRGLLFSVCVPYTERLEAAEAARVRELMAGDGSNGDDDEGGDVPLLPLALGVLAVLGLLALARRLLGRDSAP